VALAVCASLSACSSGNSNNNAHGSGGSGGTGAGGAGGSGGGIPGLCVSGTPSPDVTDVSGHWAFQTVGSQVVQAPGFAQPFHTRVISLLLVDLTQTGKDVTMKASYCAQSVDTDSVVKTVLPDAFVKSLAAYTRSGTYEVTGGVGHFKSPDFPEVLGAKLSDDMNDALPTDPTDNRVFDQDNDGHPGLTVKLTGLIDGEAYVVQRLISSYDGAAVTKDHLQGKLGFSSEQVILDSQPAAIKNAQPTGSPDPVACDSHFDASRLPASADCQYVVNNAGTLFPAK
jgi:hypothetical protein